MCLAAGNAIMSRPPDEHVSDEAANEDTHGEASPELAEAPRADTGLDLSYELTQLPGSRAALAVTVSAEEVDRTYRRVYRELSQSGAIKGFRPGHVPKEVMKRRFGEETVREYVLERLQGPALQQAVEAADIIPVAAGEFDQPHLAEGEPLSFTVTMAVRPEPRLGEYKGLTLRKPVTEITDDDIAAELDEMRQEEGGWIESGRTTVQPGDLVVVDLAVAFGDAPPESAAGVELIVGEGQGEPKLDEALVGAAKDETQTVEAAYSEDYEDEARAGRTAQVTFTVKSLRERQLPEADEAFAQRYGFETVEALHEDIRQRLAGNAAERAQEELRRQAVEQVVANSEIELPEELIAEEAEARWHSLEHEAAQEQLDVEDVVRAAGNTEGELRAEYRAAAIEALTRAFVLDAVGDAEQIEVSEADVEAELARLTAAVGRGTNPVILRRALEQHDGLRSLRRRVRTERIVDLLIANAQIEDVPLDEYLAAPEPPKEGEGQGESPEADS